MSLGDAVIAWHVQSGAACEREQRPSAKSHRGHKGQTVEQGGAAHQQASHQHCWQSRSSIGSAGRAVGSFLFLPFFSLPPFFPFFFPFFLPLPFLPALAARSASTMSCTTGATM